MQNIKQRGRKIDSQIITYNSEKEKLKTKTTEIELRMKRIETSILPQLDKLDKMQIEILEEVDNVKVDSDMMPLIFREEAKQKQN